MSVRLVEGRKPGRKAELDVSRYSFDLNCNVASHSHLLAPNQIATSTSDESERFVH
jgi:hypothetical protein